MLTRQVLSIAAVAAAMSLSAYAADDSGKTMSRGEAHSLKEQADANYKAAKDKAHADYEAAEAKCKTMSGDAKDSCQAQAQAEAKKARADAQAAHDTRDAEVDAKRH